MAQITPLQIGNGNTNSGNIIGSFNVYQFDEDAQIMRWLSPLEPRNRHQSIRNDRFDGVGGWLLKTSEFQEWRGCRGGVEKAILFCSGNPGAGKTYLSSLAIDNLCDQEGNADATVAALYCDYLSQQEQTVTNMVGAILRQLVGVGDIPGYLREEFQKGKNNLGGRGLRLADMMRMLRMAITSLRQVFICIDALDECLPKHLPDLLRSLRDIVQEFPSVRIFLTGRPSVKEDILSYFAEAVVIPISPQTDDIRNYLEMRLDKDTESEAMNDGLRADIVRTVLEEVSDIFLLVSLNMDAILGEVTLSRRKKKLGEMTRGNGLSDAYTATLTRLKAQKGYKSILGLRILMWVVYSERPLRTEELRHALGVELGSAELDVENIPTLKILLASSLGLVTVEESSSTVRLVHFTLKEHLSSDPTLLPYPHSTIAEICLTYLNFRSIRNLSPIVPTAPSATPFLEYATYYWGEHARRGVTENVKILALRLLDGFDKHISAQLMLLRRNGDDDMGPFFHWEEGPIGFTGLHAAAFLGICEIVAAVLEMGKCEVNATDRLGSTALGWAAVRGHERVVEMLLGRPDVNPDQTDTQYGKTPLWRVAGNGREGVVKILLEREDVNPNRRDNYGARGPLSWAAEKGHEGVVKMLLGRADVDPDQADTKYGRTPLSRASVNGHEGVVKMLLEREGVNPDRVDTEYGRTPLSWAAGGGHERVVKMLLERADERADVSPDQTDTKYGRTPLSWAAMQGQESVVKMLLDRRDVCADSVDIEYGRTPLSWAAEKGHEGVVKMLLERKGVTPDQVDTQYGRTPLLWAARKGRKGVVKMLLERADLNPDQADTKCGRTPLSWAAEKGHEGVVKMLLGRADVDPDQVDTQYGRTPLSWAARKRQKGVVKMLLEREDVNPDRADTRSGRTLLSWAVWRGHVGIAKLLLERKGVHTATPDNKNQTPLWWALSRGHGGVGGTLHEPDNINSDPGGRASPQHSAGHEGEPMVEAQVQAGDPNTDTTDPNTQHAPIGRPQWPGPDTGHHFLCFQTPR